MKKKFAIVFIFFCMIILALFAGHTTIDYTGISIKEPLKTLVVMGICILMLVNYHKRNF